MENPCKLVFFGDSITQEFSPLMEEKLRREYPEVKLEVINAGVRGDTSRDGLKRIDPLLAEKPEIAVIAFGMNDWRKGVDEIEYKNNLIIMVDSFEKRGSRVILNTVSPSYDFTRSSYNREVDHYSNVVRDISRQKKIKIADINALWQRELKKPQDGLRDELHPNAEGYEIICRSLFWMITRQYTVVQWQYNGREAKCNFRCPYCYYIGLHSHSDKTFGTIKQWHDNLKACFGNQKLVLYLGHGEPTLGRLFPEIVAMCESEPNWRIRLISNIATKAAGEAAGSKLAAEQRLCMVSSFHPAMISREDHLKYLFFFRSKNLEVPVVYVAYPPYFSHFEEDVAFFRRAGFLVFVRRLQGKHEGRVFPGEYTDDERIFIARYMDDGMIRYLLSNVSCQGKLTYTGVHFFIMDYEGNIGYDPNCFSPDPNNKPFFGNVFQGNFHPLLLPEAYPGTRVGTVDGVANIIEYGYKELECNYVNSFAAQGGVYRDGRGGVVYGNEFKDFRDQQVRRDYNFPES